MNSGEWRVLYTKSKMERRVSDFLTKKKFENFCLIGKTMKHSGDKNKITFDLILPNIVFVKSNELEELLIKQVDGVLNFFHWLHKPVIIKREDIALLKRFLNSNYNIKLERIPVNINEGGSIIHSSAFEGTIAMDRKFTKFSLPSLGYILIGEDEETNVTVIEAFNYRRTGNYHYKVNN